MKLEELMEMAKGKNKRASEKKSRTKKKAKNPTQAPTRNLVAKDMQDMTGAGQHSSSFDKDNSSRGRRKQDKKEIKNQMDD